MKRHSETPLLNFVLAATAIIIGLAVNIQILPVLVTIFTAFACGGHGGMDSSIFVLAHSTLHERVFPKVRWVLFHVCTSLVFCSENHQCAAFCQ